MAGVKQPADKSYFILPDLGEGVAEAELIEWRVESGQKVDEHQTLAEMETDKARVEVPSPWAGTIGALHGKAGDIIEVGSKLVSYTVAGASVPKKGKQPEVAAEVEAKDANEDAGTVVGTMSGEVTVAGRFSRQPESNGSVETPEVGKALATPAVRRIARELGIEINRVTGTGRGGRVTASDVQACASSGGGTPSLREGREGTKLATRNVAVPPPGDGIAQRIPIRGTRRKIAQALIHSLHTAAHFTVVDEADATALEAKRKELIYATGEKLSLLPFIMAALCKGLRLHPSLNANVDDENEEILIKSAINLGCAVDTNDGLMVPVLFNADQLSIVELSRRVADVATRCKNRTIPREELMGGTFTISNVGSYGGMFATPIINYPEVAILAAGRAYDKVMPKDGGIYLGKSLPLSLSCDHRVVDGAEGARFLNTVKKLLENPERLLSADAG